MNLSLAGISAWILPVIIAITFHEAAHAYVAWRFGDDTALQLGRVSFNPLRHIDPFGTILLPGMLLLSGSPFVFGYAKPVPVNYRNLQPLRAGMIMVALAGPATNIALALAAALAFHAMPLVPVEGTPWVARTLYIAFSFNILLAVFNMLPIPPLDGSRIAVGLLPGLLARPFARLEPYGMLILIGFLILLPLAGSQFGLNLDLVSRLVRATTDSLQQLILLLTGNA
ncbi:conserved hypothetical protein; putative peptidase family M50, putative membrane protein [Bradyrhizobium sp. ORS 278]|uniref:site-2 protease family protein n=1 Tax=Bradyrhizobium sp. (strain ORS 278) TaxID=114615 RepID=UPI0001508E8B|nr:site-2 protease family protein [Bradyrhizobium sp. ORS 278]CAL78379.1 conserved hypothetical protein; putative peptidase family M50, putative membrane protein [Bradyrhizobium sp. ORS 278]